LYIQEGNIHNYVSNYYLTVSIRVRLRKYIIILNGIRAAFCAISFRGNKQSGIQERGGHCSQGWHSIQGGGGGSAIFEGGQYSILGVGELH